MKRTQRIDLLTTIRGSIVSFIAITMFVVLGIALFLGIHGVRNALRNMADDQSLLAAAALVIALRRIDMFDLTDIARF